MAQFGMPSFPQRRASLLQIMILWQFGPCTVCTSHNGSVGPRAICYTQLIYPLLWSEKSRLLPSLGCPSVHNRGRPCGRLCFYGSLDPKLYVPAILGPWVQWLFGTYSSYTRLLWNQNRGNGLVWDAAVTPNKGFPVADYDFVADWTLFCMYQPYWVCWSKGLFGTLSSYTPCCGIQSSVYGQVWGALVPTNESVPMADYDFMAV